MPGWIGVPELLILLLVVLLVFGPKKLPEMGRSLGKGMREFKSSVTGKEDAHPAEITTTAHAVEEPVTAPVSTSKRELDSI
jgi:sec-independent protein translocase protein TatA